MNASDQTLNRWPLLNVMLNRPVSKGIGMEELHGLDYLVYAYLQEGDNKSAKEQLNYLETINEVSPVNFKGAYTFAAAPSRAALENKNWEEAANLQLHPSNSREPVFLARCNYSPYTFIR